MHATRFERLTSVEVVPLDFTSWAAFCDHVGVHRFDYKSKDSVPLISPAEYSPGTVRAKKNVARVHFGALDLDGLSDDDLGRLLAHAAGLEYLFYTTWSHGQKPNCGRFFFPFSRPVEAHEWASFWPRMRAFFLSLSDEKCSDQSRIFYYPSAPARDEAEAALLRHEGAVFDVDALLRTATTEAPAQPARREPLARWAFNKWARSAKKNEWLQDKLLALIEGAPLAAEGDRDNTIYKLVGLIVERFPLASPESVAELFEASARAMDFPLQGVLEKVLRRHAEQVTEQVAEESEELQAVQARIRRAFRSERTSPYAAAEVACDHEWIVQKDGTFYFFVDGTYRGPYTWREVEGVAHILLAPAASAGVECFAATAQGIRPKTSAELVHDYGQVADRVALDLVAQRSFFDSTTATLVEAPCPQRVLPVQESPRVAQWLELLGGKNHSLLLDWVASVTRLEDPCSALYLEGAKGAGKTLLAAGLAALWTEHGPTSLEDAFAAFNSQILRCPLILADEVMPTDFRGRARTGALREFIQARTRTLRRKFIPDATVRGCIRLILAANHQDMISTSESLTMHDIGAVVERILHVPVDEAPAAFLRDHRLSLDEIASHALYLRSSRSVASSSRFLVQGQQSDLHRRLTTSSGLRSAVCHWLCSFLLEPQKMDATRTMLVRAHRGKVCATSRGLAKHWEIYETNVQPPAIGPLSRALAGLATERRLLTAGDKRRTWYHVVDEENLFSWAEDNGYADRETLQEILAASTLAGQREELLS